MDVSKLYPAIEFPVSRGTPMISPLIKWDHSENYFVTQYEDHAAKSTWFITMNLSDLEFDYVPGHQIDG
jgi:fatty acid synthase, animal type